MRVTHRVFDDVSLDLDWEFVESQSFSFSKKRPFVGTVVQEIIGFQGSPVKKSISAYQKKNDAVHATAKLAKCTRELCKMGRVKRNTARGQKCRSKLRFGAGRKRGTSGQEEDWAKVRNTMLGETAESPTQEHRHKPSSHADLAGC